MFEDDYIMRMIHEIIRMAMRLLCGTDVDAPTEEILETREERDRLYGLLDLADRGEIGRAEDELFDMLIPGDPASLKTVLLFYRHLSQAGDAFLEASDFSREEVMQGIRDALDQWGAPDLSELLPQ